MKVGDKVIYASTFYASRFEDRMKLQGLTERTPVTIKQISAEGGVYNLEEVKGAYFASEFLPANAVRAKSKKHNPQAIKKPAKLHDGLFRVSGLFEGKARVCSIVVVRDVAIFQPLNPQLKLTHLSTERLAYLLETGDISIMCIERWED